jgi:hypothetical protein
VIRSPRGPPKISSASPSLESSTSATRGSPSSPSMDHQESPCPRSKRARRTDLGGVTALNRSSTASSIPSPSSTSTSRKSLMAREGYTIRLSPAEAILFPGLS